ncbi:4'-phosphopantetheinyl transferase family protein [Vreelandella utahensis]|uniref:4'-phosphopantetheinyl transferase family protein n=1 Tax=Vreelandella halophila TaxID=86177 RepID=UPI0009872B96|nr:4'-phosphopantetheinyl transferase superfamily protein [Halomonas utahensis]
MADPASSALAPPQLFSGPPGNGGEVPLNAAEQARVEAMEDADRRTTYAWARQLWRLGARHFTRTHGLTCPDFDQLPAHGAITPADAGFRSSLCHTDRLVLAAFSQGPIGVDAERVNRTPPWQALARRWFTGPETDWLQAQTQPEDAFLTLWTLKEAWIKATARGIAGNLQALAFDPENGQLLLDRPDPAWRVATTTVQGHRVCVVWQGSAMPEWRHDGVICDADWHLHRVGSA